MKLFYSTPALCILLLLFISCGKEKQEFLEGNWELINVGDIDDTHYDEWNFDNSVLTISRVSKLTGSRFPPHDSGNYRLKTSVFGSRLRIDNTNYSTYNNDWDIVDLKKSRMTMKMDIEGGMLYKEFRKRQ
jgi:hypothetical protein